MKDNKLAIGSLIINVILVLLVGYFMLFAKPSDVKEYEAEISRLKTLNEVLASDNNELTLINIESNKRISKLDSLSLISDKKIKKLDHELRNIEKYREEVRTDVRALPHDSVAGELTKYLQRRN